LKQGKLKDRFIKQYINFRFPNFFNSFLYQDFNGFKDFEISYCRLCDFTYHSKILIDKYREMSPLTDDSLEIKQKKRLAQINLERSKITNYKFLLAKNYINKYREDKEIEFLDFGCGWGDDIKIVEALGFKAFGTEIDQEKIKFLKINNIKLVNLLKEKKLYDIILCNQVLEHIEKPLYLAKLVSNHLKTNGILIIEVPNGQFIKYFLNLPFLWLVKSKGFWTMNPIWFFGHINSFSIKSLKKLFKKQNMKLCSISFFNHLKVLNLFEKKSQKLSLLFLILKMKLNLKTLLYFTKVNKHHE
jgi:SAM-dependent methyltransferase